MTRWHDELGVFDLETTGIDVETARIVTAHVGLLDAEGGLVARRDWLVDPGVEIPLPATAVHGVTTDRARLEGAPARAAVAEIVDDLRALLLRGVPVVAYNAAYDFTVLNREAVRHGVTPLATPAPIIDPLVIDRAVDRFRRGKRTLAVTADYYGVPLVDAHDSAADAVAAGRVAQALAHAYEAELAIEAAHLHELQVEWSRDQAARFEEYMQRTHDPDFTTSGAWPER